MNGDIARAAAQASAAMLEAVGAGDEIIVLFQKREVIIADALP